MANRAKDPFIVAVTLFSLLFVALLLYLLGAVLEQRAAETEPKRFVPPGWVNPTSPPPGPALPPAEEAP